MPKDEFVEEDPMELVGMVFPGETGQLERMAETIVEEYVRLGWSEQRLMTLFTNPMFMATYRIYRQKGEGYVRGLVREVYSMWRITAGQEIPERSIVCLKSTTGSSAAR